jgi:glycosyltransferase involved in cell wall biosynthesis
MNGPTLSIAVIAQNEAGRLARLLPLLRFADELLVVDGGSTDDTVGVARAAGAVVVRRPFDEFAAQRNAALDTAHGDWVLFVDADECPTPRLIAELPHRLAAQNYSGYRVPIRSTIFGRPFRFSGTQHDLPLRLVRRGAGRWAGAVHERFTTGGAVGRCEFALRHETLPSYPSFMTKMRRYTTLEARSRVRQGRPPKRADRWLRPPLEMFRRLVWKQGWLDGPPGWLFCLLSGMSEWVLATEHRRLWSQRALPHGAIPYRATTAVAGGVA